MNTVHRIVWSSARQAFVVTHEKAATAGKPSSTRSTAVASVVLSALLGASGMAWAAPPVNTLPTNGQIVGGAAAGSIASSGSAMTVTQNLPRMVANWDTFSIGSQASVSFVQPGGGVALNRVTGTAPSEIFGKLNATGSVYLLNPSGVLFGAGSQVNVGSLVATTMKLGDADFMAGRYTFTGGNGSVVNQGSLTAAQGGYIALLAPEVRNEGVISASMGQVVLGGAQAVTLSPDSSGLQYTVDQGAVQALVDNQGLVQADGGQVLLSARAASTLASAVINNSGTVQARGLRNQGGKIVLEADSITLSSTSTLDASGATGGGTVLVGGDWQGSGQMHQATTVRMEQGAVIDASATQSGNGGKVVLWSDTRNAASTTDVQGSILARGGAAGGDGGMVETSGAHVAWSASTHVDTLAPLGKTGHWLIDPYNYTVGSTEASNIASGLLSTNLTIATTSNLAAYGSDGNAAGIGNITVNAGITSTSGNSLSLSAAGTIVVNSALSITGGTAGVSLTGAGGIQLGANITTSGSQSYAGPVSLLAPVTLTSAAGGVSFSSTVNSAGAGGDFTYLYTGGAWTTNDSNANKALYTSGSTFYTPNGVTTVKSWAVGAGGGGAGGTSLDGSAGGGGGAGGVAYKTWSTTAGTGLTVSTGSAGTGGYNGSNGSAGGTSSVTSSGTTISATGGTGGQYNNGIGGAGGTGSGGDGAATGGTGYGASGDTGGGGGGGIGASNAVASNSSGGPGAVSADVSGLASAVALVGLSVGTGAGAMPLTNTSASNNYGGGATGFGSGGTGGSYWGGDGGAGYLGGGGAGAGGYGSAWYGGNGGAGAVVIKYTQSGISALTINAGSGNVSFAGAVGNTQPVGVLTINTSGATTFANNVNVTGLSTAAGGTTFTGGGSLSVLNNATLAGAVSGASTINVGGTSTFNGSGVSSTGTQTYSGAVSLGTSTTLSGPSIALGSAVALGANVLTIDSSGASTSAAAISGTGGLTKSGAGTLTVSGANAYTGATTINAGTLALGASGVLSDTTAVTVASGATLNVAGFNETVGSLAGSGAVSLGAGTLTVGADNSTTTYSGVIGGTGGLTKTGSGTFTLSGANSYTGATTVDAGTLASGASGVIADASTVTVASGASWNLADFGETVGAIAGAGNVVLGSATLTAGGNNSSTTFSGVLSGAGGLTKAGSGTLTLTGANTFTGATTINAGSLANGVAGALNDVSAVTVASGATWNLAGFNETVGSLSGSGNVTLGAGVLTTGADNSNTTFAGVVSGSGGVSKVGSGTFTVSGVNTYTGTTTVSAGKLSIAAASGLGTGNISLGGGTLEASNTLDLAARTVTLTADSTVSSVGGKTLSGGVFSGTGRTLTLTGGGNFTLTNASNDVASLVADGVGDVSYAQNNALAIGAAAGTVGINNATGNIAVTSLTGGLTVTQGIATSTTSSKTITLKAADDITLNAAITANNTAGNGGAVQILAGRSVLINADVNTDKGNLSIQANNTTSGITAAQRIGGVANLKMSVGTSLIAGTGLSGETDGGAVDLKIVKTGGEESTGSISLSKITGGTISAASNDSNSSTSVTLLADSQLIASKGYAPSPSKTSSIVLDGVYKFINNSSFGSNALSLTGANSRWLIYSYGPNTNYTLKGGLTSDFRKYGKASWQYMNAAVTEVGNGFIYASAQGGLIIDTTLASGTAGHVYGNTPTANFGYSYRFMDAEDSVAGVTVTGTPTLATAVNSAMNYGNYYIRFGTTGLTASNGMALSVGTGVNYAVAQRPVEISASKVYDNTTGLAANVITITNRVGTDAVAFSSTLTNALPSDNVGTYNLSSLPYQNLTNYNYTTVGGSGTATVTPKPLTITSFAASNKAYDGTTAATVSGATFNSGASSATDGRYYGADTVSFDPSGVTGTFANKNVGSKAVTVNGVTSGSLTGADAGNYTISLASPLPTATATIFTKTVTVTGSSNLSKVYDGTTALPTGVAGYSVAANGFIAGDAVSVTGSPVLSQAYASTNAYIYRNNLAFTGVDAGNYYFSWVNGYPNTITKAPLTMTAQNASKLLGQTNPALAYYFSGFVNGETAAGVGIVGANVTNSQISTTAAGNYAGALVPSIGNPSLSNYQLNPVAGTYTIVPADTLLITLGNTSKVYGNANPILSLASTAQYVTGVGNVLRNVSITHTGAGHYTYSDGLGTSGSFDVSTTAGSGSYVGNYGITVSNFVKTGNNFSAQTTQNGNLTISQREATLSVAAPSRVYDGTTSISNSLVANATSITSKYGLDDVAITGWGEFTNKNAGLNNKSWGFSNLTLTGLAAGNYYLASNARSGTTGTISAKPLNWLVDNANSTYGTVATAGAGQLNGAVIGDAIGAVVSLYQQGTSTLVTPALRTSVGLYDEKVSGLSGVDAANYTLSGSGNTVGTLTIAPKAIVLTPDTISKTYDGLTSYSVQAADRSAIQAASGIVAGDVLTGITLTYADKNAGSGNKVVVASGATIDNGASASALANYTVSYASASDGTINPKPISVSSAPTAANKVYDGLTFASLSGGALNAAQIVGGDALSLGMSGTFTDANAGNGKTVNLSYTLGGTSAGNYTLAANSGTTLANIGKAALTMTAVDAAKVLNDVDPTLTARYSGFVNGETEAALTSVSVARAVGEGAGNYTITPSATSTNYTITPQTGTFSIIGADTLLVRVDSPTSRVYGSVLPGYSASSALYCGNPCTDSTYIKPVTLTRVLGNSYAYDDGLGTSGTFNLTSSATDTSGVGSYGVTVSDFTKTGSNFTNQQTQLGYLTITPLAATLAASNVSKTYDGTTATSGAVISVTNKVGADDVAVSGAGLYASKNVGNAKSYTFSDLLLTGSASANYYLTVGSLSGTDGVINPRVLSVSYTGQNKTYDGTAAATFVATDNRLGADSLVITADAAFTAGKNVGTGKAIAISNVNLGGADAGNYSLASLTGTTVADITARALHVDYLGVAKTYDGAVTASVATTDDRALGDVLTINRTAAFSDKNAGNGKLVTVSGVSLGGADGGNYTVHTSGSTSADITPRTLNVGFGTAVSKQYDGTTVANVGTVTDDRISGDALSAIAYAAFASKDVGNSIPVHVSGIELTGTDALNYTPVLSGGGLTADIVPKQLTIAGSAAAAKTYDGNTSAVATAGNLSGFAGAETVNVSITGATFDSKNVGTGKNVTLTYALADGANGGAASNYSLSGEVVLADITPKALSISGITATNKVYDGNRVAAVSTSGVTAAALQAGGMVVGDDVTVGATGLFDTKNVGAAKTVALTSNYGGVDVGNYAITDQATTTADVTQKALSISGITAANKIYDGNRVAVVSTTGVTASALQAGGMVVGDDITVGATGLFDTKNVGTAKTVALSSSYGGVDVGNYAITDQATTAADVTQKALTISGITAANKTYDGNRVAAISTAGVTAAALQAGGMVAGDDITVGATGIFDTKNVGVAKTVALTSSYGGVDVGNYTIIDQANTTADLTQKALSVSGITAANKTYDGNRVAAVSTAGVTSAALQAGGMVVGDDITVSATGLFDTKNVGTSKTVALSSSYGGVDVGNYAITDQTSTTANVTQKALGISGISAANKTYDGNRIAAVNTAGVTAAALQAGGMVVGDDITVSATGLFDTKNVGTAKTVALTSRYGGVDVGNYAITDQATTTADVTQKALDISGITAANKTYDGNRAATVSTAGVTAAALQAGGMVAGDDITVSATGLFDTKNVGTAKTVALTSSYGGVDVGNYAITDQASTTANVSPKQLALNAVKADNKTYDGTTSATLTLGQLVGLVGSEDLALSGVGNFADANVGIAKSVGVKLALAKGASGLAGNYVISDTATTADINPVPNLVPPLPPSIPTTQAGPSIVPVAPAANGGISGIEVGLVNGAGAGAVINAGTGGSAAANASSVGPDTSAGVPGTTTGVAIDLGGGTGVGVVATSAASNPSVGTTTNAAGGSAPNLGSTVGATGANAGSSGMGTSVNSGPGESTTATGSSKAVGGGADSQGFVSVRALGPTAVPVGSLFSFTLPKDTFKHADPKATVVLEARAADGKALPGWLRFEAGTGRFTGRAPEGVTQFEVLVVARDSTGTEASTKLVLQFGG